MSGYWDKDRGGRPRIHKQKLERRQIMLTEDQLSMARVLGEGNSSLGVRRALDLAFETRWKILSEAAAEET